MFSRICKYCNVYHEAETLEELGLKIDQEHVKINEKRRENKVSNEKYYRKLKEFTDKRDKLLNEFGNFENYNKNKKVVEITPNGYIIGRLQTTIIEEKTFYEPEKSMVNIVAELYFECKVCGHKYYLDGSNEYGFSTVLR